MLKLEFPSEKHREMYEKMIEQWLKEEDFLTTSPWALFYRDRVDNYTDYLSYIRDINKWKDPIRSRSTLFFLIKNDVLIWAIDIRHSLDNDYLLEYAGHIGYWISPIYRRKWYATKMLALWITEAKKLWLQKLLVSCYSNNIGSQKTILNNGGVFERHTEDGKSNRYWIDIK